MVLWLLFFPGIGSAAELAADILLFPGGLGPSHRGFVRFAKRALPGTNNPDGTYSCSLIIAAADILISGTVDSSDSCVWILSNVQSIRQAYRVNSKSVRLSTGVCGSAASYVLELTT